MRPRLLVVVFLVTAAAAFGVIVLREMFGPGIALAALALVIVVGSAVFHHQVRLADEAANPPEGATSDAGAPAASASDFPRTVRRIVALPVALPFVLFAAAVVALSAIGWAVEFWRTSGGIGGVGSGSGGIGSVSAGLSEAIVETILMAVVVLAAVLAISTFSRRPR